jgi:hypothetical protein
LKAQNPQIAKAILTKKSNTGGITIPDFKLYCRAIAMETACYRLKNSGTEQWNRIEDPDMNPCSYVHLIFDKGAKNIRWRTHSLFNKCCCENWISASKKWKLDSCLSSCTSINSKWTKDLNIRPETLKLLQEKAGNTLELIGKGNDFLSRTQMAQQLRENIDKWDYKKLKCFCTAKEMVTRLKRQPTE